MQRVDAALIASDTFTLLRNIVFNKNQVLLYCSIKNIIHYQ